MNIAIITGASSGIGKEFVRQMDRAFDRIDEFWLVARRKDLLEEIGAQTRHATRIFAMDVTVNLQLERLENAVRKADAKIRILVNCAGYGVMGPFSDQDRKEETGMIRLNCEALTNLTHRMIPYMRQGSRIIQLASCAAFLPQPDFAVYAASKAYVLRFSQALGEELRGQGIYVTSVCPGPVDTPFFERAERTGNILAIKKYVMVQTEQVVAKALRDSRNKRSMSVCSAPIVGLQIAAKLLPHALILRCMRKMKIADHLYHESAK